MTIYYILLFCSATIFSFQFLITKLYQNKVGTGIQGSIVLSCLAYFFVALIFYVKGVIESGNFAFYFSWFTFLITFLTGVSAFTCLYLSIKVLKLGDLGDYSVFMMLGSIVLPTMVGIFIYNEQITLLKGVALFLMFIAVVLTLGSVKKGIRSILCYLGVFFFNGMVGVLFTVHQNHPQLTAGISVIDGVYKIDGNVFMTWVGISEVILSLFVLLGFYVKKTINAKEGDNRLTVRNPVKIDCGLILYVLMIAFIYGLCNGFGDYFISVATGPNALGASVTFPIIDGGTIFISGLIGLFMLKEKQTVKKTVSFILVIVSTVMFMFV